MSARRVGASEYTYFDSGFTAFAHRGGATYPPNRGRENTLHAFSQAVQLGYRYLETDVHATADGVLIAFHDEILDRVTDRAGKVADLPYAEVARARIHGIDPIPTLADLFEAFPDARFNIDAKSDAAVPLLADTIAQHAAQQRVCVASFGVRRVRQLRRLLGAGVPTAASAVEVGMTRLVPWLSRMLSSPAAALQIPATRRVAGRQIAVVTPNLIAAAHRVGKLVHIWTVDEAPEMNRLIELGADGIFTDRIDTLRDVLVARGLWDASSDVTGENR